MKNKILQYIIAILFLVVIVQMYSFTYVRYLKAWPESMISIMSSWTDFSLKHFYLLLINIFMGSMFGLELLLRNIKKDGSWQVDIKRLLILGVPLSLLSVEYFNFVLWNDLAGIGVRYLMVPGRETFFRFMLGYIIITSFNKNEI